MSTIRDISLAPLGHKRIEWVKDFMPVLSTLRERFVREQPFRGLRISVCVHLEAKTAYLALVLRDGGATVSVTGSNPLSTKDDICAALVEDGMDVHAFSAQPKKSIMNIFAASLSSNRISLLTTAVNL